MRSVRRAIAGYDANATHTVHAAPLWAAQEQFADLAQVTALPKR